MEQDTSSYRPPPNERFAAPVHLLDLRQIAADLQQEDEPSHHGHQQMSIFHQDRMTVMLFSFAAGGQLNEHQANGAVTIQLIEGAVTVVAEQTYTLAPAMLVTLAPQVKHSVTATQPSILLVTVCRS